MLIDSHCHLIFPDFDKDRAEVLARARDAGVKLMLNISTTLAEKDKLIALADQERDVFTTIGIHPHQAEEIEKEPACTKNELCALATSHPKIIGIGETGLDYYYEHSKREVQKKSFLTHIQAAQETKLPLIIHIREAEEDMLAILEQEMKNKPYKALIHCFTASESFAKKALALGFYISVSGIATFKKAYDLRATLKTIPLNRLLLETDAPYLSPEPCRGKRNEPSFVRFTAEHLAQIKSVSTQEIIQQTGKNFLHLFSLTYEA